MKKRIHNRKFHPVVTGIAVTAVLLGVFTLPPQLTFRHDDAEAAVDSSLSPSAGPSSIHLARLIVAPSPDTEDLVDPWFRAEVPERNRNPLSHAVASDLGIDGHARYRSIILETSERYEVDPAWIKAIIMVESSYNAQAVSDKGARGLMQLMPATARELGVKDSFDPERNIDGGVRYYRKLLRYFDGDVALALAAYNAGPSKVKKYKGVPPYRATRRYVEKVFYYYQHYKSNSGAKQTVNG
jgi:soluble lytic murein transglycosylase-like protein